MKQEVMERFISYARMDTQSDETSETCPSTPGQSVLAQKLAEELAEIGLEEITVDEHSYVFASLPPNSGKDVPVIGFLAHLDTATEITGAGVQPQIVESYDGGDIVLNQALNVVLSPKSFPELAEYAGQTLITTDGTTLLGADDKAGIAEIMTAMHYLKQHPEIKHGKIRVAFTPDEEIGRGAHKFDVAAFGAKFAYTMDGGPLGELEYESFNAAAARITFHGVNVHPGTAKGKMINSAKIAMAFHERLPAGESPEFTEGMEGFYHLNSFQGTVEISRLSYIIRDFDRERFEERKAFIQTLADEFRQTYGEGSIVLELKDQYYNMRDKIEPVRHIVDIAHTAMTNLGITPIVRPIRGGTDGSQLSYMGLPTPNIFAGGENFHGKFEYISADNMVKAAEVIIEIAKLFEQQA
ncbi:tripeptide aminopeptidase [Paenibacillus sophorae]|uniref:Peptidase T n=1 Tax=Paenibacillus sophorae TaxID=1333845 RepID=A0A1H8IS95_9BACL|nr:peptidase T [Paenibacillus sophorae]QWU16067.1 peptidase T [Paenibacillus sophorae]SEN71533.1 tripeptide aminopeptidase [Paenibacillus sophorae]